MQLAAQRPASGQPEEEQRERASVFVVLARHQEDIGWVDQLPEAVRRTPNFSIAIYQTPGEEEEWRPRAAELKAARAAATAAADLKIDAEWYSRYWPVRETPLNRGHEAMAYVTAILDRWDNLPDYFVFLHAHQYAEHSPLNHDWIIRALAAHPPSALPRGYMALQCKQVNTSWNIMNLSSNATLREWMHEKGFRDFYLPILWSDFFQTWLGPLPPTLHSPPNAEFAASAAAIRRLPKAFWEGLQDYLMSTQLQSFKAAVAIEHLWALIVSGQAVVNTPQADCFCSLYGLCLPQA